MSHAPRDLKELARATVDVALEERALARMIRDLRQFAAALASDRTIVIELAPRALQAACGKRFHPVALHALLALLRRGLLSELEAFVQDVIALARERAQHAEVRVRSAFPLRDEERSDIRKKLEKKFHGTVALEEQIDSSLLGGLFLESAGWTFDATIRGKVERLHQALRAPFRVTP